MEYPYSFNKSTKILMHATLCSVKEASHRRLYIALFSLYKMSKWGKSIETERLVVSWDRKEWEEWEEITSRYRVSC
jgi:hypothetical protein